MKNRIIKFFIWLPLFYGVTAVHAQTETTSKSDSTKMLINNPSVGNIVDGGIKNEQYWRNTGAVFTLSGEDLARMNTGNLLNTLQGRIPGLTVSTGSGEPGYDNPTLYVRGQSSWNVAGNRVLIYLDGFEVDLNYIGALSPFEIESVTLLKDAAALAVYGLEGGAGVLSIRTKQGQTSTKTRISVNGRYGLMSPVELPKVMDAYGYTTAYNQALQNDGLPVKYLNPDFYKAKDDPFHPNVDWYNQMLTNQSTLQDYNISFLGGGTKAKYFVFGNFTEFAGIYRDADVIDRDFGTNAKYRKLNLRANVDLQLTKSLSVKATMTGITEDRNTPNGFNASELFNNLLRVPASAFPVTNLNGTWGNNSVYNFNPVQLLRQNGIYSLHTRNLQTSFSFNEKLDALVKGLSLNGGVSFSDQYAGVYQKGFTVPSYEIIKDAYDNPVLDANGNITYKTIGSVGQSINDGGNNHWNRTNLILGFDYLRNFGKHTFTGMLKARRQSYTHIGQFYPVNTQGLIGNVTYDYDQKYIIDLSSSYLGSADFEKGDRYGFFPAIGLGWVATNEDFLKGSRVIDFLKFRSSYGITGNTNEDFRFQYEMWAITKNGINLGSGNGYNGGRGEGPFPNTDFTWEKKSSFNFGFDLAVLKKLSATVDVFSEKRSQILEAPTGIPDYTGFNVSNLNTGEVSNKGFEASLTFRDNQKTFAYYAGATAAFARNKITAMSEEPLPYDYLYGEGYRIDQMRGLVFDGFYQVADFDANGLLLPSVIESSFGAVKPGDLKFVDQDNNGVINSYDLIPMKFAKLPEITLGFNLGFKYAGFDFDAFLQGVMNRSVSLLEDAFIYTHPIVNNNNITEFSKNNWTPQTAATATTPRLSTLKNDNNNVDSDFWMRNGNFFKLRSIEAGYTLPQKGFLKRVEAIRVFANGTNLFIWDKIEDLEAERLSMGYPLMKTVTFGFKAKF
jgi:TonB-linked SusC/RagA family outer membrane protein